MIFICKSNSTFINVCPSVSQFVSKTPKQHEINHTFILHPSTFIFHFVTFNFYSLFLGHPLSSNHSGQLLNCQSIWGLSDKSGRLQSPATCQVKLIYVQREEFKSDQRFNFSVCLSVCKTKPNHMLRNKIFK